MLEYRYQRVCINHGAIINYFEMILQMPMTIMVPKLCAIDEISSNQYNRYYNIHNIIYRSHVDLKWNPDKEVIATKI